MLKQGLLVRLTFTSLAIFSLTLLFYIRTVQPTLGGNTHDGEEFQHTAFALSIAHPTGYPLYLLLGKLWLTALPVGNVAYRMNLLSAVLTATAAVVFFLTLIEITGRTLPSFLGAVFLALSEPIWKHALVASVGPLNLLLTAALLYTLLLWRKQRVSITVPALIFGLSLAHHRSSLALLPGIAVLLVGARSSFQPRRGELLAALLAVVAPLLFYLYIPLRGSDSPWYTNTFESFVRHVGATEVALYSPQTASEWIENTRFRLGAFYDWLGPIGMLFAILGMANAWRGRRRAGQDNNVLLALALMTLGSVVFGLYVSSEVERFLAPALMFFVIWAALGVTALMRALDDWAGARAARRAPGQRALPASWASYALGAVMVIAVLANTLRIYPLVDLSHNDRTYRLWNEIVALPLEPNAVLLGNWSELNALRYMQYVEGRRRDLQQVGIVDSSESVDEGIALAMTLAEDVYLMPGAPMPSTEYHYRALGPLLRVSREPDYNQSSPPAELEVDFGSLELLGYGMKTSFETDSERAAATAAPGQSVRTRLYWRVKEPIGSDYDVRVRLLDEDGVIRWQKSEPPLRGFYPTSRWQPNTFVTDSHGVSIPPGAPPGTYEIQVALIDSQSQLPLPAQARIPLNVTRSPTPLADQIFVRTPLTHQWAELQLLGVNFVGPSAPRGGTLDFSLVWQAQKQPAADYTLAFLLSDAAGNEWHTLQAPVLRSLPTSQWQRGDAFRAYYALPIPKDAPAGLQRLSVRVLNQDLKYSGAPSDGDLVNLITFSIEP